MRYVDIDLPTRKWLFDRLKNNDGFMAMYDEYEMPLVPEDILDVYIVGSTAKNTARPDSDIDIALVVDNEFSDEFGTDIKMSELFHLNADQMSWKGRKIDIQWFFNDSTELMTYSKIRV